MAVVAVLAAVAVAVVAAAVVVEQRKGEHPVPMPVTAWSRDEIHLVVPPSSRSANKVKTCCSK